MVKTKNSKKIAVLSILVLLCAFISIEFVAQVKKSTTEERKKLEISNFLKAADFNGSILVASHGKIILSEGFGMADKEKNISCTNQTRFMIGSITKQFTSMAIMQLEEKGLLNVDDNIEKYIPGFPHGKEITIHQLLSHTSGLPRDVAADIKFDIPPTSIQEALSVVESKGIKLLAKPGEIYSYSNTGYEILGLIIQKVSGETYEEYVQKNIFNPLGMKNSGFGYNRNTNAKLASSYSVSGDLITKDSYIDCSIWPYAAGEIYSTVEDLYKWDRVLYTEKLVSKKTLNKIFTPVKSNYGYGWEIITPGLKGSNNHDGQAFGFISSEIRLGNKDAYCIILSNIEKPISSISSILISKL